MKRFAYKSKQIFYKSLTWYVHVQLCSKTYNFYL